MDILKQPVSLLTFCRITIAKAAQQDYSTWYPFLKRYCPITIQDDLLLIVKIASLSSKSFENLTQKHVARELICCCLRRPHKLYEFEVTEFEFSAKNDKFPNLMH